MRLDLGAVLPVAPPQIPDHELLRRVGEGAYGEVWLARNVMGTHRAVKIVYRRSFSDDRPYEREFAGIKRFEPIWLALVIIGGLNWAIVALFDTNVVSKVFGTGTVLGEFPLSDGVRAFERAAEPGVLKVLLRP